MCIISGHRQHVGRKEGVWLQEGRKGDEEGEEEDDDGDADVGAGACARRGVPIINKSVIPNHSIINKSVIPNQTIITWQGCRCRARSRPRSTPSSPSKRSVSP
jgi:hypothetical protein